VNVTLASGLQARTPTGKMFGPTFTLLLSKPTTFQVSGVSTMGTAAAAGVALASQPDTIVRMTELRSTARAG